MAAFSDEIKQSQHLTEVPQTPSQTRIDVTSQSVEAFKDIVFGSTAGTLGKFVEYPFDTVKVRLQSQPSAAGYPRFNGPLDAFKAAFRAPEGPLKSLYRGITAPLVGAAVETSSLFFSYRIAQDIVVANTPSLRRQKEITGEKVELPFTALLGCGAVSGAFTSLLLTPIELIKCKMQVPTPPSNMANQLGYASVKPPTILRLIAEVFRNQGVLGFWHGQMGTLIRETGGSAAWFGAYEGVKILFMMKDKTIKKIDDVKIWQQMVAGAAAGMSYNFFFYPADTIKSRMQTEAIGSGQPKTNFFSVGKELWREQGLRGYYRGCGITVFRSAPSSAIIFSIYEALRKHFS